MEVLVLGGHVIDGLNKKETAPPGLAARTKGEECGCLEEA